MAGESEKDLEIPEEIASAALELEAPAAASVAEHQAAPAAGGMQKAAHGASPPQDSHDVKPAQKKKSAVRAIPWKDAQLLLTGVFSPDAPTRKMSWFFLINLTAFVSLSGYWFVKVSVAKKIKADAAAHVLAEQQKQLAEKHVREDELKASTVSLGKFTLELKAVPGLQPRRGLVNIAEAEIVVLCDDPETAEYIDRHRAVARSTLFSVLIPMDREELLSKEGKKRWKSVLMKQLNAWLGPGHVVELYFSRLEIN